MKDRLEELLKQKRLLEEHLRWLEREIEAEESGNGSAGAASTDTPLPEAPATDDALREANETSPTRTASEGAHGEALTLLPEIPEVDHASIKREVRYGCLIYATVFTGVVLLTVSVLYLMYR